MDRPDRITMYSPITNARPLISGTTAGIPATSVSSTIWQWNKLPIGLSCTNDCPTASFLPHEEVPSSLMYRFRKGFGQSLPGNDNCIFTSETLLYPVRKIPHALPGS